MGAFKGALIAAVSVVILSGCENKVSVGQIDTAIDSATQARRVQFACYDRHREQFKDLNFSAIKWCDELLLLQAEPPNARVAVLERLVMDEAEAQELFALEGRYQLERPPPPPKKPKSMSDYWEKLRGDAGEPMAEGREREARKPDESPDEEP